MVCGNKADLGDDRAVTFQPSSPHDQVTTETGLKWAKDRGLSFLETSAKNGNNVNRAFQLLLQGKTVLYFSHLHHKIFIKDRHKISGSKAPQSREELAPYGTQQQ